MKQYRRHPLHTSASTGFREFWVFDKVGGEAVAVSHAGARVSRRRGESGALPVERPPVNLTTTLPVSLHGRGEVRAALREEGVDVEADEVQPQLAQRWLSVLQKTARRLGHTCVGSSYLTNQLTI